MLYGHFRNLWFYDHFFYDDAPAFEAWTILSFLAARFPYYEIGSLVLRQGYRNPALLALMSTTLQTVTEGRLTLGIGAGYKEDEYLAYNYDYPRAGIRLEQLEDVLNILRKMWSEPGQVSYTGKHHQITHAWCEPKPDPMIPILLGASKRESLVHPDRPAVQAAIWRYSPSLWGQGPAWSWASVGASFARPR